MIFRENNEENLAHTVFTQYINEQENQMEAELAFDASFFKANRKVNRALFDLSFISHLNFPSTSSRGPLAFLTRSLRNNELFTQTFLTACELAILPVLEVSARKRYLQMHLVTWTSAARTCGRNKL